MANGWIKLHRKFMEWEWYHDQEMKNLFIHLLLEANHADKKWQGVDVKRGQLITGRKQLSLKTGLSEQKIRTCLNKLKSTNELTIKSTSRFSLITICNWETYQFDDIANNQKNNQKNNQQSTSDQPASNQRSTTNKNVKKEKNVKKTTVVFPNELDFPEFHKAWAEWQQHRKEIRKKLTPTTIAKQLKMLVKNPAWAATIINKSIENGWTGLFPMDAPRDEKKICVVDRKPGVKYQTNGKGKKIYLCQECVTAFTASGSSSWGHLRASKIEEIILKQKADQNVNG